MATPEARVVVITARPIRSILHEFLVPIVEGEDELDQAQLIDLAFMRFQDDEEFLRAAARDLIPTLVPDVLARIVHQMKGHVKTSTGYLSKEALDMTARERYKKVFEGTGSGYKSLLKLKKKELLDLCERDERTVSTMQAWISFRRELASKMNDDQVVGDLSSRVLENTWNKHFDVEA